MANLKTDCLGVVPMAFNLVERAYKADPMGPQKDALCLSHERLRAELEGAEAMISEMRAVIQKAVELLEPFSPVVSEVAEVIEEARKWL